jgi:hypothetical protein
MVDAGAIGAADTPGGPMPLQDDVSRLTAILVRQHQDGLATTLRYRAYGLRGDAGVGKLAKASGASPSVLRAWEDGDAMPTTSEGLAWLSALYGALPRPYAAQPHKQQQPGEATPADA